MPYLKLGFSIRYMKGFKVRCVCVFSPPAMEILGNLSKADDNSVLICEYVDQESYREVMTLLSLPDLMLLMASLEVLYLLAQLGEIPCSRMASVDHSIGTHHLLPCPCLYILRFTCLTDTLNNSGSQTFYWLQSVGYPLSLISESKYPTTTFS